MSALRRTVPCILALMSLVWVVPTHAQQQNQDPQALWAAFNHYVLIARPDLAKASGEAFLKKVDDDKLLEVVESSDYTNYDQTLQRAAKIEALAELAEEIEGRIQQARIDRARDETRIQQDIQKLAEGQRPYRNAVERLAAAGQYAVPQMLVTLRDANQSRLHPYIISALVQIGRPAVYPLAVALPDLNPVTQSQVSQVLGQIGYPMPMPYLKMLVESPSTDPDVRRVAEQAFDQLRRNASVSGDLSAAELFLALGRSQYRAGTTGETLPGYDASQKKGMLWRFTPQTGLVATPIPGMIFGDVLAMRSARHSLELDPQLAPSLSLYLMANLRRDLNLPLDQDDPSYGTEMRAPSYYAMLAGPERLHDVLAQALADNDAPLALAAIEGLSSTAGTDALVRRNAATQPLLQALSYPDRRVRFRAAEALANARPQNGFPDAQRVVPVLAEAIRQSGTRIALVLADDQESLNNMLAAAGELGFAAFGGLSLEDVSDELANRAGVDLVLVQKAPDAVEKVYRDSSLTYKLAATPVLAVVTAGQQYVLRERLGDEPRLFTTVISDNPQELRSAVEQATASYAGAEIDPDEAEEIALRGLEVLHEIAIGSTVYDVADAMPALVQALDDERFDVVVGAGRVLALIDDAVAQRAIAKAALASTADQQISLMDSLATSANSFGNLLTAVEIDPLQELVRTAEGDEAVAAAKAYGALSLPTAAAVQAILQ